MQNIINELINIEQQADDILSNVEKDRQSLSSITTKIQETVNNMVNKQITAQVLKMEDENKNELSEKIKAIESSVKDNTKKIKEKFYSERENLIDEIFSKVIGGHMDELQRNEREN